MGCETRAQRCRAWRWTPSLDNAVAGVLEDPVPGQSYSAYIMLHDAIQHTLDHTGQLALLKKAIRS
jgi:hypothetical protein